MAGILTTRLLFENNAELKLDEKPLKEMATAEARLAPWITTIWPGNAACIELSGVSARIPVIEGVAAEFSFLHATCKREQATSKKMKMFLFLKNILCINNFFMNQNLIIYWGNLLNQDLQSFQIPEKANKWLDQ